MNTARWIKYKDYSGFVLIGERTFSHPVNENVHLDRAVFLAGQLESKYWGTVQNYDGCGMSGGILHNTAVLPSSAKKPLQIGSLLPLISSIVSEYPYASSVLALVNKLNTLDWYFKGDVLHSRKDNLAVSGREIRAEFSGSSKGAVKSTGPEADKAVEWLTLFSELLSSDFTFALQSKFAANWIAENCMAPNLRGYSHLSSLRLPSLFTISKSGLSSPELELALCMYFAFVVNAPSRARKVLLDTVRTPDLSSEDFSVLLIRNLGKDTYGNWKDSPKDGSSRYDKARRVVWESLDSKGKPIWDPALSRKLMPQDLT